MDFVLMSCPYCGRAVDSSDPKKYVCQSCGKFIYTDRKDVTAFIRPGELEDRFKEVFAAVDDKNEKKAMDIAEDLIETTESNDYDCFFVRGYVYEMIGEDGKAIADWRKGLEMLSNNVNLDAYVCLMSKAICDMILYKEREYIEFNILAHIDKLTDDIDACTGMSTKALVYYTVYCDCMDKVNGMDGEGEEAYLKDIIPLLFRRVIAYHRNLWCLSGIIDEYLAYIGYNPETYEEDDNEVAHVYDLIRIDLNKHISQMTDEDRIRIFDRWDDKSLKENTEPLLDSMIGAKKSLLDLIRKKDESETVSIDDVVAAYVDKCLLIESPDEPPTPAEEQPSEEKTE